MKTLIITAHPSSKGFTHKIAQRYQSVKKAKGNEVEIINLYDIEWKQDFFAFEDIREVAECKVRNKIQKKITEADELVFVFPVWWCDSPAILKNFFDTNFTSGFAFRYTKTGKVEKLLKGKTAKIFVTCDAPKWIYWIIGNPLKTVWKYTRLEYCGIKLTDFVMFDKKRTRSEEDLENCLQNVEKK